MAILINEKTWITADLHLSHGNIIKYCKRPFADEISHDKAIISNWNAKVAEGDLVFLLGDVAFNEGWQYLKELHGTKVLIRGNHDNLKPQYYKYLVGIYDIFDAHFRDGEHLVIMCHYPLFSWRASAHGSWHLHGHSHGNFKHNGIALDVGIDCWNYSPVEWPEIKTVLELKQKTLIEKGYFSKNKKGDIPE